MQEKDAKGSCCGVSCGCCVCKTVKGLLLLLVGGVLGFCVGRGCKTNICPVPAAVSESAPASAPAKAPKAK